MMEGNRILIEVGPGELLDRITILELRANRLNALEMRKHVCRDLAELLEAWARVVSANPVSEELVTELRRINSTLWSAEDELRRLDRAGDFGVDFLELARSVCRLNDERSMVKRRINELLGSRQLEEKCYRTDEGAGGDDAMWAVAEQ